MKLIIYTCECLLDHLVRMTEDEIEKYIMNHVMFSLSDRWLMYIHLHDKILFLCFKVSEHYETVYNGKNLLY